MREMFFQPTKLPNENLFESVTQGVWEAMEGVYGRET